MRACVCVSIVKDTDKQRAIKDEMAWIESTSARKCFKIK